MGVEVGYSTGVSADSYLSLVVLGYLIDCLLMGIVLHQTSAYFQNFPNHRTVIQRMVRVIFALCVAQTVCNVVACIHALGLANDELALFTYNASSGATLGARLCNPFLMGVAHVLLAHRCLAFTNSLRVWNASHMLLFRAALWAATVVCWAFGLSGIVIIFSAYHATGVVVGPVPPLVKIGHSMAIGNLVSASVLDSIIAAVMIWELRQSKTAFQGTKSVVETMSRILVANGFLLSVYQLAIALAFAFGTAHNASALIIVANDLIGKIYAITSLLAICRPLEAERLRNNPSAYAQRSRGSAGTTAGGTIDQAGRKPPLASTTTTAGADPAQLQASGPRRRGSSMRPSPTAAARDLEACEAGERGPLDLNRPLSASDGGDDDDDEKTREKSSAGSSASDAEGVSTLRFVDQAAGSGGGGHQGRSNGGGLTSLALPVNIHQQPSKLNGSSSSSRGSSRPSTAPSSYNSRAGGGGSGANNGLSSLYSSPPTPVRTIPGMGNQHGLDLDYICAPMEEEGVVRSPSQPRGPSPRLFE